MLPHIDGSKHQCFGDERWYDLIVILDDATSDERVHLRDALLITFERPKSSGKRIVRDRSAFIGVVLKTRLALGISVLLLEPMMKASEPAGMAPDDSGQISWSKISDG